RTPPFHGGNRGSNPLGDANSFSTLWKSYSAVFTALTPEKYVTMIESVGRYVVIFVVGVCYGSSIQCHQRESPGY
ncbi:MAG: hypothetical protein AAFN68_04970, partial [Pseudomonadota bacterium]